MLKREFCVNISKERESNQYERHSYGIIILNTEVPTYTPGLGKVNRLDTPLTKKKERIV